MPGATDEFVVSGFSGRFPRSEDIEEFKRNLFGGVDMVTEDHGRWNNDHYENMPCRLGALKYKHLENIDGQFFTIPPLQCKYMDPQMRMLLECTQEAMIDAGVNPQELRGSETGVYVGVISSDIEQHWLSTAEDTCGFILTGCTKGMYANRLSYHFDLKGPSMSIDTACSSSLTAFGLAYRDLISGRIDSAIVGGSHVILNPQLTSQYYDAGVLSPDGKCKSFDKDGNGFVRAEAIGVTFIQKKSVARRNYANILNVGLNTDGYKTDGLTTPSGIMHSKLLRKTYGAIGVQPNDVYYVETHGPGSRAGDPQEIKGLEDYFGIHKRKEPLLVGSLKSNMGHAEGASAISAIIKMLLCFEERMLPANLHFNEVNPKLNAIIDGRIKVVTKNISMKGDIIGINSFGYGGANVHAVLKMNTAPQKSYEMDRLPRLVCISGRTNEGLNRTLDIIETHADNPEYLALINEVYGKNIQKNSFRGYILLDKENSSRGIDVTDDLQVEDRPIWFIYSGMGSQWTTMGKDLMKIDICRDTLQRCADALAEFNVDLINVMTSDDQALLDNDIINPFIAICATQIALTDLLTHLNITPNGFLGHSLGEMACSYADGGLTLEQTMKLAYYRGYCFVEHKLPPMLMASLGLSWTECDQRKPAGIELVCNNGGTNVTVAGPVQQIQDFVNVLSDEGVFARTVRSCGVISHCHYTEPVIPKLLPKLHKLIPNPKERTSRWLSTSIPENRWNLPEHKYCSADYQVNNIRNPVLFHETVQHIPKNAICIEMAPHGLFLSILKKSLGQNATTLSLMKRNHTDNVAFLLESIGKLYAAGAHPNISKLYAPIAFPVSRGTPMLNKLVDWDHSMKLPIPLLGTSQADEVSYEVDLNKDDAYINGHFIDGRVLYPATGYITLVWKSFAKLMRKKFEGFPIVLENVVFHRATIMPKDKSVHFRIKILDGSGRFEVSEGSSVAMSGTIYIPESIKEQFQNFKKFNVRNSGLELDSDAVYKEFRLRGYDYSGKFRGILSADSKGYSAKLAWDNNWITFLDTMLQCTILGVKTRDLHLPIRIQKIVIDPLKHLEVVASQNNINIPVKIFPHANVIESGGVQIYGLVASLSVKKASSQIPIMERYSLVPYHNMDAFNHAATICFQICMENSGGKLKFKIADVANSKLVNRILSPTLQDIIEKEPLMAGDITLYTTASSELFMEATSDGLIAVAKKDIEQGPVDQGCTLIVGYDVLLNKNNQTVLENMKNSISESGFILLSESVEGFNYETAKNVFDNFNLVVLSVQRQTDNFLILLRQSVDIENRNKIIIKLTEASFDWLPELKAAMKNAAKDKTYIYIVSENEEFFGAVGLANCLKTENGGIFVRLFYIPDCKEPFSFSSKFYGDQLKKDLLINVYKNNTWNCYRHLQIKDISEAPVVDVKHALINTTIPNDLSSLKWVQSRYSKEIPQTDRKRFETVTVYYTGLNFKDVVLASGKLAAEKFETDLAAKDSVLGYEFAGRDSTGKRVFGIRVGSSLATTVEANRKLLWYIPSNWTMAEASALPVVYCTVYSALLIHAKIKKGETILIHAGSGGVGQAAISVALFYGCKVYTTVSTDAKREFVKKIYPELTDDCFGYSRDTSFEQFIMEATDGKGVDVVLNSLADDKLQASFRCLSQNGRFIDIGRVDQQNNSPLGMGAFCKNTSFKALYLEATIVYDEDEVQQFSDYFADGIKTGAVRLLNVTLFDHTEIESAFRYIAAGKHLGKVVVRIRDEEDNKNALIPKPQIWKAVPKTYLHSNKSYILVGGLGGFGLEVADWLVTRNAKKIILTSRTGVKTVYQSLMIKRWIESGVQVVVNTDNVATEAGARNLLQEARKLGTVGGIFNLAVVLRDKLIEDQTESDYKEVSAPKINATKHLDKLSKVMCPELDYFVCFSSLTSGRGNIGQSNYGMANSTMERICENRHKNGLPGVAIQWGAIGDTGILIESLGNNQTIVGGTLPQKMSSCLETLDLYLQMPHPILSCMVLAGQVNTGDEHKISLVKLIANILGIRDPKNIADDATLASLGVDSLMVVEIKQILERNYDTVMGTLEIRQLNIEHIKQIESATFGPKTVAKDKDPEVVKIKFFDEENHVFYTKELLPLESVIKLESTISYDKNAKPIFICCPLENTATVFKQLANHLKRPVYGLQCTIDAPFDNVSTLARFFIDKIKAIQSKGPYIMAGYSYGASISYEIVVQLEKSGEKARFVAMDGSPEYVTFNIDKFLSKINDSKNQDSQILSYFGLLFANLEFTSTMQDLMNEATFEDRVKKIASKIHAITNENLERLQHTAQVFFQRFNASKNYRPKTIIKAPVTLIKAKENYIKFSEDYGLQKICEQKLEIFEIDGDHRTFMTDNTSAAEVAKIIDSKIFS